MIDLSDSDAVLTLPVAAKGLQAITRRHTQIIEPTGDLELAEFASSHCRAAFEPSDPLASREGGSLRATERADHAR
jgi:hypothetical protein